MRKIRLLLVLTIVFILFIGLTAYAKADIVERLDETRPYYGNMVYVAVKFSYKTSCDVWFGKSDFPGVDLKECILSGDILYNYELYKDSEKYYENTFPRERTLYMKLNGNSVQSV